LPNVNPSKRGSDEQYQTHDGFKTRGTWNGCYPNHAMRIDWKASLVPAAAVIPAPEAYANVAAVKKLVVCPWVVGLPGASLTPREAKALQSAHGRTVVLEGGPERLAAMLPAMAGWGWLSVCRGNRPRKSERRSVDSARRSRALPTASAPSRPGTGSGMPLPNVDWVTSGWYAPTPDQTFGDENCSCYESSSLKIISGMWRLRRHLSAPRRSRAVRAGRGPSNSHRMACLDHIADAHNTSRRPSVVDCRTCGSPGKGSPGPERSASQSTGLPPEPAANDTVENSECSRRSFAISAIETICLPTKYQSIDRGRALRCAGL